MTQIRPVCVKDKVEMRCVKNATELNFGDIAFYRGDMYECPVCRNQIVTDFSERSDKAYNQTQIKMNED